MICGGRDADLRLRGTMDALRALSEKGWISNLDKIDLSDAYVAHRQLEHRIQMLDDAQSHSLPVQQERLDRLARFSGWSDTKAFVADLGERLHRVRGRTEAFFSGSRASEAAPVDLAAIFARPAVVHDGRHCLHCVTNGPEGYFIVCCPKFFVVWPMRRMRMPRSCSLTRF
jgi:[glutamine synthetase] adenylyltransferase / [glutamine synthetase]-adenylyl-L-tyrosine phosphorylase